MYVQVATGDSEQRQPPRTCHQPRLLAATGALACCGLLWQALAGSSSDEHPIFSFGIVADVQWADVPDGSNFERTRRRHYRGALRVLADAVDWWLQQHRTGHEDLAFIAQLGDLIDGQNAQLGASQTALRSALRQLLRSNLPLVHCTGNHDLYNFNRKQLALLGWDGSSLAGGAVDAAADASLLYYAFAPRAGVRMIVLGAYEEAVIGWPQGDARAEAGYALLAKHNPNDVRHGSTWFEGLEADERRFVPYNGGFGRRQLEWFGAQLEQAAAAGELVLVLSHVVLHPRACDGTTMAWDFGEALLLLERHRGRVLAVLCGHDHKGGYHRDEMGVHHLTLRSPLDRGEEGKAFGLVRVHRDRVELVGPALGHLLPLEDARLRPLLESAERGGVKEERLVLRAKTPAPRKFKGR